MNFTPFGAPFAGSIPTVHQFTAKFAHNAPGQAVAPGAVVVSAGDTIHYIRPEPGNFANANQALITMPVNVGKYARDGTNATGSSSGTTSTTGSPVVSQPTVAAAGQSVQVVNPKYHVAPVSVHHFAQAPVGATVVTVAYAPADALQLAQQQQQQQPTPPTSDPASSTSPPTGVVLQQGQQQVMTAASVQTVDPKQQQQLYTVATQMQPQDLCASMLQQQAAEVDKATQTKEVDLRREDGTVAGGAEVEYGGTVTHATTTMPATWQSLATPGSTVADYLSRLPASTLPLSLHHFLKFSTDTIKKETDDGSGDPGVAPVQGQAIGQIAGQAQAAVGGKAGAKKKKKKKTKKPPKPRMRPGQVQLTTALDGTTLFCCPECHMAYPEKELLEQHLIGHKIERRFICDICGAGLKRKEHLDRHKQGHNPDRPYVCTVCLKAFKRKEHLNLHFVIHSGEKTHVCTECGKGFYRKDHLRKHSRSHFSKRVKAELSQELSGVVPAPMAHPSTVALLH
ncbi:zinc finger and BTB domain-containing protein 49-like [Ischnura elegans]|uniref:zinc finger and BTB domain-containing protein 49-like n=1 Tax=Ischnura elegans TaxID=197161 RepID=UPI001ED886D3|nr:zinc finger and BTB domain-containing protein 49-like [Ischnura elegans]XP_046407021.1 zinc finger and BTB domain-containing protein 49-like [Ischnura elegans]XP_046407028.1 zinc finger and BTB domain-containing protein 49-like [Ischnura elegans]XP_046407038.1 zinc finger and BTB domain-containing protein 49-like [Ischnura elegans]